MKMYIIFIITIIIAAIGAIYFKLEDDKKHLIKESTLEKKVIKYQGIIKLKDHIIKQKDIEIFDKGSNIILLKGELYKKGKTIENRDEDIDKLLKINQKLTKFITKLKSDAKDTNKSN